MRHPFDSTFTTTVPALAAALLLAGCASVIDPYVEADSNAFRESPSLANAVIYAEDTREKYYQAIREHAGFNRFVGTSLIGASAAAIALGVGGGGESAITKLGVGAAGLYGLSTWLNGQPRMLAFQAGIEALNCTLTVYEPVRAMDGTRLEEHLGTLPSLLSRLDAALAVAQSNPGYTRSGAPQGPTLVRGRLVLANGRAALDKGRQALAITARAGVGLYDATQNIRAQVTKALIDAEGSLAELVASLSQTIPANAGLITGAPLAEPPADTRGLFSDRVIDELRDATARVLEASAVVEREIAALAAGPSAADVASCAQIDAVEAGILFAAEPATVVIDTGRAEQPARLILRGGKTPYYARWVNQVPTGVVLGVVNHEFGGSDEAEVMITVAADAPAGAHQLSVSDAGKGRRTVLVSVVRGSGSSPTASTGTATTTTARRAPDPTVKQVQARLVALDCLVAVDARGKATVDGLYGDLTRAAIARWIDAQSSEAESRETLGVDTDSGYFAKLDNLLKDDQEAGERDRAAGRPSESGCSS